MTTNMVIRTNNKSAFDAMDRLMELFVSMCYRYAELPKLDDELAEKRRQRKIWVNLIVVRKMYARKLDEQLEYYTSQLRRVDRLRELRGDEEQLLTYRNSLMDGIQFIKTLRLQNGYWLLDTGCWLEHFRIHLSDVEVKTALSIPDYDWQLHSKHTTMTNYNPGHIAFEAGIGERAVVDQVIEAAIQSFMSAGEKTENKVRWKMQSLGLYPV